MDLQSVCYCLISPTMKRFRCAVWHWSWIRVELVLEWLNCISLFSLKQLKSCKNKQTNTNVMLQSFSLKINRTFSHDRPPSISIFKVWQLDCSCFSLLSWTTAIWNSFFFLFFSLFWCWQSVLPGLINNPKALSTHYPNPRICAFLQSLHLIRQ